jgi:hypothetical protein
VMLQPVQRKIQITHTPTQNRNAELNLLVDIKFASIHRTISSCIPLDIIHLYF